MKFRKLNLRHNQLTKYVFITVIFAIFILFIDKYSVIKLHRMNKELKGMKQQVNKYDKEYEEDSAILYKLKHDPEFREKYAREHYFMKRPNEDVYFIQAAPEDSTK